MAQEQIVDLRGDVHESARARARLWVQITLPFVVVVVIAGGLLAGTWYQYQRNRADVLALSRDFVGLVEDRVQRQVTGFLRPAADGAASLAAVMPSTDWFGRGRDTVEAVGMRLMARHQQIGLVYVGRGNGDFIMLRRASDGAIDTKLVRHQNDKRRTSWVRRDPNGDVAAVETDPDDTYDPRTRGWYKGALESGGMFWSDVYVFFTDKSPGITVATPVAGNRRDAVVGVDVRLKSLNDLLSELQGTVRGRAVIVDGRGRVVAAPGVDRMLQDDGAGLEMPNVHAIGDPVLSEAFDRSRLRPDGSTVVAIDGTRHIVATASLAQVTDRNWRLLLVAPESAFAGFVAANNQRSLVILGGTVLLAAGMAGTLAYQGVRAERTRRRLAARDADRQQQLAMMDRLMAAATARPADGEEDGDLGPDVDVTPRLAAQLARSSSVARAGVWQRHGAQLVCLALFDAQAGAYTHGTTIERHECPALFDALDDEIAAADAAADPRTRELATCYLTPAGMRGVLSVPVRMGGESSGPSPLGAVWLETDAERDLASAEVLQLARLTAGLLALRWRTGGEAAAAAAPTADSAAATPAATEPVGAAPESAAAAQAPASTPQMRTSALAPERAQALRQAIQTRADGSEGDTAAGAALYPHATVAVVRLLDEAALASAAPEAGGSTASRVIDAADRCAAEVGLPYIKLLGARIVAVDGFDAADAEAAVARVAEFALNFREPCTQAFRDRNQRPAFSIGIDTGPLMGAAVGFGQGLYDVWGEALEVADSLAAEATAGCIQVSGSSYAALHRHYLLRPIGTYFLERAGEMPTYDLRAAL